MTFAQKVNLILRSVMEAGIVFAFGWWGYHTGDTRILRILYMVMAPVIGFGFWSVVDFHQMGSRGEPLRLAQELIISLLAAFALYSAELKTAGIFLASLSLLYHLLVYLSGNRLLKR